MVMENNDIFQWDNIYPNRDDFLDDIRIFFDGKTLRKNKFYDIRCQVPM